MDYFNELLGYLLMSITSIPVKANDKNKPECIFSSIDKVFFNCIQHNFSNGRDDRIKNFVDL